MDKTKEALLLYQLDNKILPNFNIPKLYTISHYPEIIRVFSALIGTTIKYSKNTSLVLFIQYNIALRYSIISSLYNLYLANNIKSTIA